MIRKFAIAIAALACLALPARADTLPDFYLGKWCIWHDEGERSWTYSRDLDGCREFIIITPTGFTTEGGETCRFTSIRRGRAWPAATKTPMRDWIPSVTIAGSCKGEYGPGSFVERLEVRHGGDVTATPQEK
jgi:hypothetical protein